GIRLSRLQVILRSEGQRLPVDVPCPELATLGGALAANVSGPRRYGLGTLRDYVIGISIINDEGQETKAGGQVVKNVAGYDLCKLHIGALGTLGIISQVTLKLRPMPEETVLLIIRCEMSEVETALDRLDANRTRAVCIDVVNGRASAGLSPDRGLRPDGVWAVIVGFEENREAVRWQLQQVIKELSTIRTQGLDA